MGSPMRATCMWMRTIFLLMTWKPGRWSYSRFIFMRSSCRRSADSTWTALIIRCKDPIEYEVLGSLCFCAWCAPPRATKRGFCIWSSSTSSQPTDISWNCARYGDWSEYALRGSMRIKTKSHESQTKAICDVCMIKTAQFCIELTTLWHVQGAGVDMLTTTGTKAWQERTCARSMWWTWTLFW